ncbi:hypothetical protein BaRGS_00032978 [Batillaria attramentaria]|uniref:Uncharacterized protein n=1 Tax=Batillaria attramentaria TaxID=370345 RepID=A0ABD0JMP2_9CAEN
MMLRNFVARFTVCLLIFWLSSADVKKNVTRDDKNEHHSKSILGTPCFVLCNCTKAKADCSRNYGKLTYVPRLPSEIRTLDFSYNDLREIQNPNFFINVTGVTSIDLSNNELTYLNKQIFLPIRSLRKFVLDNNPGLNYSTIERAVFSLEHLGTLSLRNTSLRTLPPNAFNNHSLPRLTKLSLGSNQFYLWNLSVFAQLPVLKKLYLDKTLTVRAATDFPLSKCKYLALSYSGLYGFPETCKNGHSMFPRLLTLKLLFNYISHLPNEICLPKLLKLHLGYNLIHTVVSGMFSGEFFPKMKTLNLISMPYIHDALNLHSHAFNNTALSSLYLMYNNIRFDTDKVHPDVFAGCTSLETLQVSHNYFTYISDEKFQRLFAPLLNLRTLYMGSCGIREITSNTFDTCPSLQMLSLYKNKLVSLPDGAFDKMMKLT